jgi:hypothetical protein
MKKNPARQGINQKNKQEMDETNINKSLKNWLRPPPSIRIIFVITLVVIAKFFPERYGWELYGFYCLILLLVFCYAVLINRVLPRLKNRR